MLVAKTGEAHPENPTSSALWVANPVGRYRPLSWGDPWYTSYVETHIYQVARRLGELGPLLNWRSGLFMRNGVLLCKQFILSMMFYAYPVWRSISRFHMWKLQVLQSKCLCIATSEPWNTGNKQVHENLGVPISADHVRSLIYATQSWCGEPLIYVARQISTLTEHWARSSKAGRSGSTTCPSYPPKTAMSIH